MGKLQRLQRTSPKKVSDKLHQIFKNDREAYEGYWSDISSFIKFGCIKDDKFYDRIKDILLLKTIDGEYKTLEEYPKDKDGKIFYVTDEDRQSQYIKMFHDNGLNAVVLTHAIDPHFISLLEYKDHDLHFNRIDADINEALKDGELQEDEKVAANGLAEKCKEILGKEKLTVKAEKLKTPETPAVILLSEYARRIQDMNRLYGEEFSDLEPEMTLVLNSENPLVQKIPTLPQEQAQMICRQIYDLALLGHKSLSAQELSDFVTRSVKLMEQLAQ